MNIAYARRKFAESLQQWSNSNPFNGPWKIETERRHSYSIHQWYARPTKIGGQSMHSLIDPHHIFIINRSRCCSKGKFGMGIKPEAWWTVEKESKHDNTGLSLEIEQELRDRRSNSFAQTTSSEKPEKVREANGSKRERERLVF